MSVCSSLDQAGLNQAEWCCTSRFSIAVLLRGVWCVLHGGRAYPVWHTHWVVGVQGPRKRGTLCEPRGPV